MTCNPSEAAGASPICPLSPHSCRHLGQAFRILRREFTVIKTRAPGCHVNREDLGAFCNMEGLFTAWMDHGCPLSTGYNYLEVRAPRGSRMRALERRTRIAAPVPVPGGARDRQLLLSDLEAGCWRWES